MVHLYLSSSDSLGGTQTCHAGQLAADTQPKLDYVPSAQCALEANQVGQLQLHGKHNLTAYLHQTTSVR